MAAKISPAVGAATDCGKLGFVYDGAIVALEPAAEISALLGFTADPLAGFFVEIIHGHIDAVRARGSIDHGAPGVARHAHADAGGAAGCGSCQGLALGVIRAQKP